MQVLKRLQRFFGQENNPLETCHFRFRQTGQRQFVSMNIAVKISAAKHDIDIFPIFVFYHN